LIDFQIISLSESGKHLQ